MIQEKKDMNSLSETNKSEPKSDSSCKNSENSTSNDLKKTITSPSIVEVNELCRSQNARDSLWIESKFYPWKKRNKNNYTSNNNNCDNSTEIDDQIEIDETSILKNKFNVNTAFTNNIQEFDKIEIENDTKTKKSTYLHIFDF